MMTLFDDTAFFNSGELRVTKFDIPDAELTLVEHFFNRADSDRYYKSILEETPWKQEPITLYDKTHLTPRLTAWYSHKNDSGHPGLTKELLVIQEKIEAYADVKFSGVLLNYYRSGKDGVSWHRDHDRDLGPTPVIGSVSFGETRPFQIRHKFRKDLPKIEIPLNHGSFLLMAGPMQHYWEHQIPKTARLLKPRLNLTYRMR